MITKNFVALIFCLLLVFSLFTGCNSSFEFEFTDDMFVDALKAVAPVFSSSSSRTVTWDNGFPLYELYGILTTEEDVGGYFNLYGLMDTADMYFSELSNGAEEIDLQSISLPSGFETGIADADKQYNLYNDYDGEALSNEEKWSKTFARIDGDNYYMLVVARNQNGTEDSNSVVQGKYNESTGDIDIEMIYNNKVDNSFEKTRARVTGNTETHQFSLKAIRSAGYSNNIIGYGISQGTGSFLMKMAQSADISAGKYYAFDAANLTSTALQAMDDAGSDTDPGNTTYTDELEGITAFTTSDVPTDTEADINIYTSVTHE